MTIANRLAVGGFGGSWVHLPPFNLYFEPEPLEKVYGGYVPGRGFVSKGTKAYGWRIPVEFSLREATVAEGLALAETLRQALMNGTRGRIVDLCSWVDSGGTVTEIYRNCQVVRSPKKLDRGRYFAETAVISFELQSNAYPTFTTDSAGSAGPSSGDYEDYLIDGGTAAPMSPLDQRQKVSFYFDEMVETWSSGSEKYFAATLETDTGGDIEIHAMEIPRARTVGGGSGVSEFTVSTTAPGVGGGTQATIDLAYGARRAAKEVKSVTVTNGAQIYLWCSDGTAMHAGVQVDVWYK